MDLSPGSNSNAARARAAQRSAQFQVWAGASSFRRIVYILLVLLLLESLLGALAHSLAEFLEAGRVVGATTFGDLFFFALATQLPIGGASMDPVGICRWITIVQGIVGTAVFGIWVSLLLARLISPHPDTLILAPYAIFLVDEGKLAIMAVNTSGRALSNLTFGTVFKQRRRHVASTTESLPYLKDSVLLIRVIKVGGFPPKYSEYDPSEDGLKVAIEYKSFVGGASVAKKYPMTRILIAENDNFMDRPEFQRPDLESSDFWRLFKEPTKPMKTIHDYVQRPEL